ncbi:hypothetical protein D9613_000668 [Agrocybe pediades]|uniref:C4-dicarboxylate transporter/malic acid transport protein n=1 Tax=Agrocybe pediades TaxID=84607 RepID=A0A8H4R2E3_9AGAR|nr:hypothetical protein D9613_000668 [Agrocybe pediades]
MGTGSVSVLAANFHWGAFTTPLKVISLAFFLANLAFYTVILAMTIARYFLFPELWSKMLYDPGEGLFVGAFPIGSANLIDMGVILNQRWHFGGHGFLYTMWAFWWFILGVSYFTAFGMLYVLSSTRHHMISQTTAVWVLPIIPLIVLSATGGSLAQALIQQSTTLTLLTSAFSLVSFCVGMSITLMMLTLYLIRLILRGPPLPHVILASFIVMSPLGQGGSSLLVNGEALYRVLPLRAEGTFLLSEFAGQALYIGCFIGAWVLWSMGLTWIIISLSSILIVFRTTRIPFSLSCWGLVFPNGVFALCSVRLGIALDSPFFNYFGAIWSSERYFQLAIPFLTSLPVFVLLLWIGAFIPTVTHLWDTSIFTDHVTTNMLSQAERDVVDDGQAKRV